MSEPQDPQQWQPPPPPGDTGAAPPPPSYGTPPPPPSYGTPPGGGYGQPAAYGAPTPGWSGPPLAEWPKRAGAYFIDAIGPGLAVYILVLILGAISDALALIVLLFGYLGAFAFALYNAYLAGQTGQSIGMQRFQIRLVRESDGQSIGGGLGIARYFVHFIDSIPCIPLGFLWPLWDQKKQTFTDKVFTHVVIDESR